MHLSRFRLRFTVRRLMVATAIIAAVLAAWLELVPYWELSKKHREKVDWFESMALVHVERINYWENQIAQEEKDPVFEDFMLAMWQNQAKRDRIWLEYHRGLIAKYRRAARFPWLPVEPDPPRPF